MTWRCSKLNSESKKKVEFGCKSQNCDLKGSFGTVPKHWTGIGYSCNGDLQRKISQYDMFLAYANPAGAGQRTAIPLGYWEIKVTVYLQWCLAYKRCGVSGLNCRYVNPYIKLKLIGLAIRLYQKS